MALERVKDSSRSFGYTHFVDLRITIEDVYIMTVMYY